MDLVVKQLMMILNESLTLVFLLMLVSDMV